MVVTVTLFAGLTLAHLATGFAAAVPLAGLPTRASLGPVRGGDRARTAKGARR